MKDRIHIIGFMVAMTCLMLIGGEAMAFSLYFSSSAGDDSRTFQEARNPKTPWKTIEKLNGSMELIGPGDSVLFMRGDIFQGQITLTRSGREGARIVFTAYGTGRPPIIMGDAVIVFWTLHDGNIWMASLPEGVSTVSNFLIDGYSQQIGRYPNPDASNGGYLMIDSHVGHSQLISGSLGASPQWTGAEAVVRTDRWILDRVMLQSHSGSTVTFSEPTVNEIRDNYGFFFQKHIQTLDQQGEWYHDEAQKRIYLYSEVDPNERFTTVSANPYTFLASNRSHFSIEGLEFRGSHETNLRIFGATDVVIQENAICESGMEGVLLLGCRQVVFKQNRIIDANDAALTIENSDDLDVQNNEILKVGLRAGMGDKYAGVRVSRSVNNLLFANNRIDSIGYTAMSYRGDFIRIKNNYIAHFCMTIDDGAGLYTDGDGVTTEQERYLENNIVMYAVGAGEGTDAPDFIAVEGIYTDDRTNHVNILNNTVAYCNNGIFVHNSNHITILGNILFDNTKQIYFGHDYLASGFPITACEVKDNIFFSKLKTQSVAEFVTIDEGISLMGVFDNNYYCRPLTEHSAIFTSQIGEQGRVSAYMSLERWKATFHHDPNSHVSPFPIAGYEVLEYLGDNLVENGTLDSDRQGWSYWSTYNNGYAVRDEKEEMDGGSLKMGFDGSSGKVDSKMQSQVRFSGPEKDQAYLVSFSNLASDQGNTLRISMLQDNSPYDFITGHQYVNMNDTRTEYELLFIPESTEPRSRIVFDIAEGPGPIWLDNVTTQPVNAHITNMDDHVRLVYNTGSEALAVEVPDNSYDVRGNLLEPVLMIQPFSSIIIMNGDAGFTAMRESGLSNLQIYPNPANRILNASCPGMNSKYVTIIDLSGRLVLREYKTEEPFSMDISALHQGLYLLQISDGKKSIAARFIKN